MPCVDLGKGRGLGPLHRGSRFRTASIARSLGSELGFTGFALHIPVVLAVQPDYVARAFIDAGVFLPISGLGVIAMGFPWLTM